MKQQILKFVQNLLLLALFSLFVLAILGGLYFEGTFVKAIIYALISVFIGSVVVWVSSKTFLKSFSLWDWRQNTMCALILIIVFTVSMILSSGI